MKHMKFLSIGGESDSNSKKWDVIIYDLNEPENLFQE